MNRIHWPSVTYYLLPFVLVLAIFSPLLFSQKYLLFNEDTLAYDYPLMQQTSQAIQTQTPTDWNPYYLSGFPSFAAPVEHLPDAIQKGLLFLIHDPYLAYHVRIVLGVWLGLFFCHLFARAVKLSPMATLVLSLGYLVGNGFGQLTANQFVSGGFFAAPCLFWLVLMLKKKPHTLWWIVFGGTLVSLAWMYGFVQVILYAAGLSFAFAIYLDIADPEEHSGWHIRRFRLSASFFLLLVVSALVALPFHSYSIAFQHLTTRVSGFATGRLVGLQLLDVWNFLIPDFFLSVIPGFKYGYFNFYLGSILSVLFLLVLGVMRTRAPRWIRGFLLIWGLSIVTLIPPISHILYRLPILSSFQNIRRILLTSVFLFSAVAAFGLDSLTTILSESAWRHRVKRIITGFSIYIVVFLLLVSAITLFASILPWQDTAWQRKILQTIMLWRSSSAQASGASPLFYQHIFYKALLDFFGHWRLTNLRLDALLLFPAGTVIVLWLTFKHQLSVQRLRLIFCLGVILNICVYYVIQYPELIERKPYLQSPAIAQAIHARETNSANYRLSGFLSADTVFRYNTLHQLFATQQDLLLAYREILSSNSNQFDLIPRTTGYEPFATKRFFHLWNDVLPHEQWNFYHMPSSSHDVLTQKKQEFFSALPFLATFNVKYILSGYPLTDPRLTPVPMTRDRFPDLPLYVYENTLALPRVFFSTTTLRVPEWQDSYFDEILQATSTPVYVECVECGLRERQISQGSVHMLEYQPGSMRFQVDTKTGGWVFLSESFVPGWSATIDGVPTPLRPANYLLQALFVPAGSHEVVAQFSYSRWSALRELIR